MAGIWRTNRGPEWMCEADGWAVTAAQARNSSDLHKGSFSGGGEK